MGQHKKKKQLLEKKLPPVESDKINSIKLHCIVCSQETGKTMDVRASVADPVEVFGADPEKWRVKSGVCDRCNAELEKGHTLFFSETRGCIVGEEGSKKFTESARGKIWKIPEDKMDELLGVPENLSGFKETP